MKAHKNAVQAGSPPLQCSKKNPNPNQTNRCPPPNRSDSPQQLLVPNTEEESKNKMKKC